MKIRTVIIDDEPDAVNSLELIIKDFTPDLAVIGTFTDPLKALKKIPVIKPDLVFLDINMPGMNGFELLEKLKNIDFHVIFTTAHDEYAIKAFKFGVANYLLKPIDIDDLTDAVKRLIEKSKPVGKNNYARIANQYKQERNEKIAVSSHDGVHYIKSNEIIYMESFESIVYIYLKNEEKIIVKKSLKDFENILPQQFIRIHNSYIVNIHSVKKLIKTEQWSIEMENQEILPIARRKRNEFIELITKIAGKSIE